MLFKCKTSWISGVPVCLFGRSEYPCEQKKAWLRFGRKVDAFDDFIQLFPIVGPLLRGKGKRQQPLHRSSFEASDFHNPKL